MEEGHRCLQCHYWPCSQLLALYLFPLLSPLHCQAGVLWYGVLSVFHSVSQQSHPAQQESLGHASESAAGGISSYVSFSVFLVCRSQGIHDCGVYTCAYVSPCVPLRRRQKLLGEVSGGQEMTVPHGVMERVRDVP